MKWNYSVDCCPRSAQNLGGVVFPTRMQAERACKQFLAEPNSSFPGLTREDFNEKMVAEIHALWHAGKCAGEIARETGCRIAG